MLDSGLPRKSDVMTTSMVAGAPRTDDLLILVAPPRVQSTYDGGRSVAVIFMISCRDVEMGDLCPATPKRGAREEEEEGRLHILSKRSGARNRNRTAVIVSKNFFELHRSRPYQQ